MSPACGNGNIDVIWCLYRQLGGIDPPSFEQPDIRTKRDALTTLYNSEISTTTHLVELSTTSFLAFIRSTVKIVLLHGILLHKS